MNRLSCPTYRADLDQAIDAAVGCDRLHHRTVLVTGASGTIGSFLVDALAHASATRQAGITALAAGRSRTKLEGLFGPATPASPVHCVEQGTPEWLTAIGQADYVIHAAGPANPAAFRDTPVDTMTSAFDGTQELLTHMRPDATFVLLSTGEVYGRLPSPGVPIRETELGTIDPMSVRACYPMAKRAAETLSVAFAQQYGRDTRVGRLSHVLSGFLTPGDDRVSADFVRDVLAGRTIVVRSAGTATRCYTYIADAAAGIFTIATSGAAATAYNVATTGNTVTIASLATRLGALGAGATIGGQPDATPTPADYLVLDNQRLRGLGWSPRVDLDEALRRTLTVARELSDQCAPPPQRLRAAPGPTVPPPA